MDFSDFKTQVMAFIFLAVIAAALVLALTEFNSDIAEDITATSYTNVTKVLTNATAVEFPECITDYDLVITAMYNGTAGTEALIGSGNYSISTNVVTVSCSLIGCSTNKAVNYSCRPHSEAYNITGEGERGVLNATGFFDTIGTLLGVALIIFVVGGGIWLLVKK